MAITRQSFEDVITIAKLIRSTDLEGQHLRGDMGVRYHQKIKPKLESYRLLHGKTPNLLLKDYLTGYKRDSRLGDDFVVADLHFVGHALLSDT